jgi:molecular chaperone GrpE
MTDDRKGPPKLDVERLLNEEEAPRADAEIEAFEILDAETPEVASASAAEGSEASLPAPPADDLEARHLRLRADFENFRRRAAKESEDLRERAAEGLLRELLPILDNLGRGLADNSVADDPFRKGIALVHRQLLDLLKREGLEPIDAMGQQFDPERHEAVTRQETTEVAPGTVVEEMQKGYRYRGRLLRPSLVKVAAAPAIAAGASMPERASWDE